MEIHLSLLVIPVVLGIYGLVQQRRVYVHLTSVEAEEPGEVGVSQAAQLAH